MALDPTAILRSIEMTKDAHKSRDHHVIEHLSLVSVEGFLNARGPDTHDDIDNFIGCGK